MTPMLKVANYWISHAEELALEVVESVLEGLKLDIPDEEKNQAVEMYTEFLQFLGDFLINKEEITLGFLIEWSRRNSEQALSAGKVSEIALRYPETRRVLSDLLTRVSIQFNLSLEEYSLMIKQVHSMLDVSLNQTIFTYERLLEKYKEETQKELAELSAPIVPVKNGVIVLPLIGVMDSFRAQHILDVVVPKLAEQHVDTVILDFSGLLNMGEENIQFLNRLESYLTIMGIEVILTGMRPQLAKVAVNNGGLYKRGFKTFSNVQQALERIV